MYPECIELRGAKVNNLKNLDIDIPLGKFVVICGVSGSGKSTLAMDVLYAEGSRRYLQSLSTYTRRRIGQVERPNVESIKYLPSAIALRQRPIVPGVRSTVGTMSEVLNVLRLVFSRLGSHVCPNGHRAAPSIDVAQLGEMVCSECGCVFHSPSAEDFAFNSAGACRECHGTGEIERIDESTVIGDVNKTIRDGAVLGWRVPGSFFYVPTAEKLGIPVDIPYYQLTDAQKEMVMHGPRTEKIPVIVVSKGQEFRLEATFLNAIDAVHHAYKNTDSDSIRSRLAQKFYHVEKCCKCGGSRFRSDLLNVLLLGKNIAEVSDLSLDELRSFVMSIPSNMPLVLQPMARKLSDEILYGLEPLINLGLGYLSLSRAGGSLSTGELQRIQLAKTLRNETTGVLYVLDEPSIGLHPMNVDGLMTVFYELLNQGNSLVVVDHDLDVLRCADHMLEMGYGAGYAGGNIIAQGSVEEIQCDSCSVIGGYLSGEKELLVRDKKNNPQLWIECAVGKVYNLRDVVCKVPVGSLTAVTGVSGSGKSTMIFKCLVASIEARLKEKKLPEYVMGVDCADIKRVVVVDAVPVGKNIRSSVATYSGILDDIRQLFASTQIAKEKKFDASYFSYNLKPGACEKCGGTGVVSLDIQYLPDMEIVCPCCGGKRYSEDVLTIRWNELNISEVLALSVDKAIEVFDGHARIIKKLESLSSLGLGYLTLGESTTQLSGGEAQRLKLVSEIGKSQKGALFVFDEPTTGLHPKDIRKLLTVLDALIEKGGTVIVIEHDLDMIANADYVICKRTNSLIIRNRQFDYFGHPCSKIVQIMSD